jgi:hemolysin activation/secretion protein
MNAPQFYRISILILWYAAMLAIPGLCLAAPSQDIVLREINVSSIVVDNNRIIPRETLDRMISPYLNRRISYVDLELLRNNLTQWVIQNGYINSGVIVPDQDVSGGIVHLAVVEGKLTSITIDGARHFSDRYFIDRLKRRTEAPFRISNLQEAFQILYQDQRITAINAELSGGLTPGEGNLNIRVSEASPWQLSLSATNDNNPSIGSYHGSLLGANRNLTGCGDTLEINFGGSEGGYDYGARYARPLNSADTTLDLYFRRGEANVIDPLFKPLDIISSSATYGGRISHPLARSVQREVRVSLAGEYRESTNYLLGEGFSFSSHEKEGLSRFSVLRPGLEWIERRDGAVIVGSTLVSTGVTNESFFTWQGHLLWMQRTGLLGSRIHLRGEAQLADTGLPPMEKYALGGLNSVRGYRKNVLVKDNGINASAEWWFPLVRDSVSGSEHLSVAPFFDYGRGWDSGHETVDAAKGTDLASVGLGIRGTWKGLSVDFFYGYGFLTKGITSGNDPQEQGIHFAVTWNAF